MGANYHGKRQRYACPVDQYVADVTERYRCGKASQQMWNSTELTAGLGSIRATSRDSQEACTAFDPPGFRDAKRARTDTGSYGAHVRSCISSPTYPAFAYFPGNAAQGDSIVGCMQPVTLDASPGGRESPPFMLATPEQHGEGQALASGAFMDLLSCPPSNLWECSVPSRLPEGAEHLAHGPHGCQVARHLNTILQLVGGDTGVRPTWYLPQPPPLGPEAPPEEAYPAAVPPSEACLGPCYSLRLATPQCLAEPLRRSGYLHGSCGSSQTCQDSLPQSPVSVAMWQSEWPSVHSVYSPQLAPTWSGPMVRVEDLVLRTGTRGRGWQQPAFPVIMQPPREPPAVLGPRPMYIPRPPSDMHQLAERISSSFELSMNLMPRDSFYKPSPTGVAAQQLALWASWLGMHDDTTCCALHLWGRICMTLDRSAAMAHPALLACMWIAAKLDESRKKLPGVSHVAGLLTLAACQLNAMEVTVMELLDWAPLRGWDDQNHVKGWPIAVDDEPPQLFISGVALHLAGYWLQDSDGFVF